MEQSQLMTVFELSEHCPNFCTWCETNSHSSTRSPNFQGWKWT